MRNPEAATTPPPFFELDTEAPGISAVMTSFSEFP